MIMDFLKNRTPSQCFGYKSASAAVLTKNILLFHTSTELIKICAVIFSKKHPLMFHSPNYPQKQHRIFDCHPISTPDHKS